MTDLRVSIVSAKLLVGPAGPSGVPRPHPAGPSGMLRPYPPNPSPVSGVHRSPKNGPGRARRVPQPHPGLAKRALQSIIPQESMGNWGRVWQVIADLTPKLADGESNNIVDSLKVI